MHPQSLTYRSPVYRKLLELDAEFAEINGYAVAMAIGDASAELIVARHLVLCDCSGLTRIGLKGPGAIQWIAEQGFTVPEDSNRALRQHDGTTLAETCAPRGFYSWRHRSAEHEHWPLEKCLAVVCRGSDVHTKRIYFAAPGHACLVSAFRSAHGRNACKVVRY